jgi:O-glycosyl hydrolase
VNTDGSIVAVVMNRTDQAIEFNMHVKGMDWSSCLPAHAIASYVA